MYVASSLVLLDYLTDHYRYLPGDSEFNHKPIVRHPEFSLQEILMIVIMIEVLLVYYSPFHVSAIWSLSLISGNFNDNLYCDLDPSETNKSSQEVGVCTRMGTAEGVPCEYLILKKFDNKV